jgi:hypothetical protein
MLDRDLSNIRLSLKSPTTLPDAAFSLSLSLSLFLAGTQLTDRQCHLQGKINS